MLAYFQMVRNRPDFYRCYSKDQWRILPWGASDSKRYRLSCVRYVASSLSSSKAMFLLTERVGNQPSGTYVYFIRHFATQQHRSEPEWLQKYVRNAAAGLASSWRRWTEAAIDRCLESFQAKRHRWRSWWVAQMSHYAREIVWKEDLLSIQFNSNNAYVVLHTLFVNFMNIKQVLLCLMQYFVNFVPLHFTR